MNYKKDIFEVKTLIKHLSGQHDQSTHGNRFRTIAGKPRLVHVGGKRGRIEYDKEGKPIIPSTDLPPAKTYDPYEISQNPPPLDYLKQPKAVVDGLQKKMKIDYTKKSKDLGISVEEYAQKLDEHAQKLMKNAIPFMRIRGSSLQKVLEEGRFKSQFETNTSGGLLDPDIRAHAEHNLFGYDIDDTPPEKRPVYGYFADNSKGLGSMGLSSYGEVSVRFKSHVKEKATVTMGDSLGIDEAVGPKPANHVDRTVFANSVWYDTPPLHYKSLKEVGGYPEAQYHDGLSTSDIDHVILTKHSSLHTKKLILKLNELNIPYSYHED